MPTATGPNGEKLVLQNGQWVPLGGAAPASPVAAPVTIGRPDPYRAEDQSFQRETNERSRRAETRAVEDQSLQRQKFEYEKSQATTVDPNLQKAIKELGIDELLSSAARARNNLKSWWSTGVPGAIAGNVPGSERNNLLGNLEALKGAIIMEKLQALKDASKTGASGMGALSEREGDRLAAAVASLSPNMSEAELRTSLDLIEKHARSLKDISEGRQPAESKPKPTKLAPEQQQEFFRVLEREGPAAADAYLHKFGLSMQNPEAAKQPYSKAMEYAGDFASSTGNIVSGMIQGAAALPDLAAKTAGQLMAIPVGLAGFNEAAEGLRHPFQIGETVESVNPTPTDTLGKVNRVGGQIFGGAIGFPQKTAQSVVNRVVGSVPPMPPTNALAGPLAAAKRQDIELIPADVGGPTTRRMTAGAVQSPYGAGPVIAASERSVGTARAARDRIAAEAGKVLPEDEAGEVVRQAADVFSKQTSQRGARLYTRADKLTGGAKVSPGKAIDAIDQQIAELAETPELNQPLIRSLEKLKSDFAAAGGVSVGGLRNMRTALRREAMTEGLRGGDTERRFGMVLDALKEDIAAGIPAVARQAFLRADQFWAKRVETIDDVLEPVLGKKSPKSGEDVLKGIESMAQGKAGGAARFRQLMAALPEDEASTIRATVISRLGKAKPGNQDAAGTVFSPAELVTKWSAMSAKGKSILFGNGELRSALDDLVEASGAMKAAGKYANTSNTAGAISANMTTAGLGGAGVAMMTGHPLIAAAMTTPAIAQRITGKLMASPKFVRWLARTPKDPRGLNVHVARLSVIAEANPAIRNDVLGLQQAIVNSLDQAAPTAGRLAASPDQGPQNGAQPQQ